MQLKFIARVKSVKMRFEIDRNIIRGVYEPYGLTDITYRTIELFEFV